MNHPQADDWRRYPFQLVPGDSQLDFPAAEANHPDCESDTWFLAGELTGEGGRGYAFLSIFNKNRPGLGDFVADFYTFALFDLDAGTYGTYTDYDMPPANMQPGAVREDVGRRRMPRHRLRLRRGKSALADLPRRKGRPAALYLRRHLRRHRRSRCADASGPARHAVTGTGAVGRRGFRRADRVLRPGRYVFLSSDRPDDDGNARVGLVGSNLSAEKRVTSTGSGFR